MPAPFPRRPGSGKPRGMQAYRPLRAAAWMMGAVVSFVAMAVAGREIQAGDEHLRAHALPLGHRVRGRSCRSSGAVRAGFAQVRSLRPWLHLKRNLFHYTGQNLWFFAVAAIPLSQLVALEFTNPIWVALLAPFLLGERLTRARIAGAGVGFARRPRGRPARQHPPRRRPCRRARRRRLLRAQHHLHQADHALRQRALRDLLDDALQGTASLLLSLPGGIPAPSAATLPWLIVVGLTGLTAHYSLTSALGYAPASIVAPMEFVRLPLDRGRRACWLYGEPLRARGLRRRGADHRRQPHQPARAKPAAPGPDDSAFCCTCEYARRPRGLARVERAVTISKIEPGVNPS